MARYIDCSKCYHKEVCAYRMTFKDTINDCKRYIHTADVEEVKHGEWITRKSIHKEEFYVCSVCKTATDDIWRYCPNCGAKMDGKDINVSTK